MAERITIWGVDYSGSRNNDPWVTTAALSGSNLSLESCFPLPREELTSRILALSGDARAVVGVDFPFGIPRAFAEAEFGFEGTVMPEMWEKIAMLVDLPKYIQEIRPRLRQGDLRKFNKLLRQGDRTNFPEAYSPLNPAAPEMFAMTFFGMSMLHTLWTESICKVPPLDKTGRTGPVLLETMPGAILRAFSLPAANYKRKNKTNGGYPEKVRSEILDGLKKKATILLQFPDSIHQKCMENHDCLDSLVAAIGAAMWAQNPEQFRKPGPNELAAAQLEGWIYAPRK